MTPLRTATINMMAEVIDNLTQLRNLFCSDSFVELLENINEKDFSAEDIEFLTTLSEFRDVVIQRVNHDTFSF